MGEEELGRGVRMGFECFGTGFECGGEGWRHCGVAILSTRDRS